MRGPCCTGLQPDSCPYARALPGVRGVAAHSPLFNVQWWVLLPISAKCMVWSHWYPFGIRLLFTNPSPQLLITCTCEVLFARGGFPRLLCCLLLLKALVPLFWPSISHQSIAEIHILEQFLALHPVPSTHNIYTCPKHRAYSKCFQETTFYLGVSSLFLDLPSTLHICMLWHILAGGRWRKPPILESHFKHLTERKVFILCLVWSQRLA